MGTINRESSTDAPPPEQTPEKYTGNFVYQGLELFSAGQREKWARVVDWGKNEHPVTDLSGYWKPGRAKKYLGSVYELSYTLDEKGELSTITFPHDISQNMVGQWPIRSDVREWSFMNETSIIAERMEKASRSNVEEYERLLLPIQKVYHRCRTRRERTALLALVMRLITGA